ncbi:MAG: arylsulfatase [Verrucomicrobiota bacterium]
MNPLILRRVAMAFVLVMAVSLAGAQPAKRPNVLLIMADDLGYSDLGCYGGEIATPNLDRLAANGLRFTQVYNTSRCMPTRVSLMTGLYSHQVGMGHMINDLGLPGYRGRVADRATTMAEVLRPAGYRAFMCGKWHLGTTDPTERGFEEFYGTLISAGTFWDANHYLRLPKGRVARAYPEGQFYGTDALTDHALDFLGEARRTPDKPWFLYLAYNSPHFPLHARKEDIAKYAKTYEKGWDAIRAERHVRMKQLGVIGKDVPLTPRSDYSTYGNTNHGVNPPWDSLPADRRADLARRMAIFAAMVDRMDQNIGRVLADLRARGEWDNTLILFLSDNGACAEWDPHGFDTRSGPNNILHKGAELEKMGGPGTYHSVGSGWANASNTPWRLYKHYVHEGGISTPFIAHWPAGMKRKGEWETRPLHIIDVMPTLVELAGAAYPKTRAGEAVPPMEGRSLLPVLRGEATSTRALFFEHEGNRAVREGQWKLVSLKDGPWELYDLATDRTELRDLASAQPERVRQLAAQWTEWAARCFVTPGPKVFPLRSDPVKK